MTTLERDLLALADAPISLHDLELLELESIEILTRKNDPNRKRAEAVLRMAAEIRKARGIWDADTITMSEDEIDTEIAVLRGAS